MNKRTDSDIKSILLVGVGGQGTILASKILSEGLMRAGHDVKMSEIHGMSQRGGSVTTHVRFGENGQKVYSPIIDEGSADGLVSFEKVEAVRWLSYLKPGGFVIVNDYEIHPLSVLTGAAEYPAGVIAQLERAVPNVLALGAGGIAGALGGVRAQNIVLLGALVRAMRLDHIDWLSVMKDLIPPKMYGLNARAFEAGANQYDNKERAE